MNEKAIFEIGNIIHIRNKFDKMVIKQLTAKEIIETHEYKVFKKANPELCRLAEFQGVNK